MKKLSKDERTTILFLSWRDIEAPKMGGAEIFTHEMIKRLDRKKYRIIHISPEFEDCHREKEIDGVTYLRSGNIFSVVLKAKNYYKKNKENIDYVVDQCNTHRFFTKFWTEKNKRIFFIHQLTREIWDTNLSFPWNWLGKITETPLLRLSKDDNAITVSDSTKNDLVDVGFPENKITILPEGIDFKHWDKKEFLTKEKEPTFIYVGRYSNYKGIDKVVRAFSILKADFPSSKLWIVGKKKQEYIESVLTPILTEKSISWGNEAQDVVYWGFVSEAKKLELMSRAHCLLFPSQREGWGLIITEAAAVGTPSIGYNSHGIRDALNSGKAGYLCGENTIEELVELMKNVIEDKKEYQKKKEEAYNYSLNFHWDNTALEFDKFMEKIKGDKL
ncbi:glycosyltransferase family 4 protein [uncultured Ilyobacter sp.]|uniref:glycosyltransferase family 4 protein n=1 Tax=uncultured Ilyobacter sp. TaxID=544433 RepID=UPI002AA84DAF|nr:glycosyltransferase family 4 protein [uncultured Ilyobacter sp.]